MTSGIESPKLSSKIFDRCSLRNSSGRLCDTFECIQLKTKFDTLHWLFDYQSSNNCKATLLGNLKRTQVQYWYRNEIFFMCKMLLFPGRISTLFAHKFKWREMDSNEEDFDSRGIVQNAKKLAKSTREKSRKLQISGNLKNMERML